MKNFKWLAMASMVVLMVWGCSDDEVFLSDEEGQGQEIEISSELSFVNSFRVNQQEIESLLSLTEEEESINKNQYLLGLGLKDIMKEEKYYQYIYTQTERSSINSLLISDFINYFPEVKLKLNNFLESKNTSFEKISSELTYKNIDYLPSFYIPNQINMDVKQAPLFSPGIDADADKDESLEDYLFCWYLDEDNKEYEVVVGENHLESSKPLVTIDLISTDDLALINSNVKIITSENSPELQMKQEATYRNNLEVHSHKFLITQRYESTGRSEFNFMAFFLSPENTTGYWSGDYSGYITDVRSNDIGKYQTKWKYWFDEPRQGTEVAFNTYEYDWNRSQKTLGYIVDNNNAIHSFGAKRRFTTDCYWTTDINNNSNQNNPLNYTTILNNWAAWQYGDYGNIRLWKVIN